MEDGVSWICKLPIITARPHPWDIARIQLIWTARHQVSRVAEAIKLYKSDNYLYHVMRNYVKPIVELFWYLQRHSSFDTQTPSCSTVSPGQPQVQLHLEGSKHSVSSDRSEQERAQGFPQTHVSCPPPQSVETGVDLKNEHKGFSTASKIMFQTSVTINTWSSDMLTWADSDVVMATAALLALSQTGKATEPGRRAATLPGAGGWPRAPITLRPRWPGTPWTMNYRESKKSKE